MVPEQNPGWRRKLSGLVIVACWTVGFRAILMSPPVWRMIGVVLTGAQQWPSPGQAD